MNLTHKSKYNRDVIWNLYNKQDVHLALSFLEPSAENGQKTLGQHYERLVDYVHDFENMAAIPDKVINGLNAAVAFNIKTAPNQKANLEKHLTFRSVGSVTGEEVRAEKLRSLALSVEGAESPTHGAELKLAA